MMLFFGIDQELKCGVRNRFISEWIKEKKKKKKKNEWMSGILRRFSLQEIEVREGNLHDRILQQLQDNVYARNDTALSSVILQNQIQQ